MRNRVGSRLATDLHDEEVRPYMQHLMNNSISTVVELNSEPGPSKATQVRGPTLLKDVWNLPSGRTIVVQFNRRNQSIGKEGRKLASFLGIIARNPDLTPLNVDDWRLFDEEEKTKLVEFARKKFSIPIRGEEFVKKSIGKKWRDYKCDLKALYLTKYKTRDALIKVRPSHIPRDQWNGLISYWLSDKAKKRSQLNRISRAKQTIAHTGGSKSIATLMNEQINNLYLQKNKALNLLSSMDSTRKCDEGRRCSARMSCFRSSFRMNLLCSALVDKKEENQSNKGGGKSQDVESSGNSQDSNKEDTVVTSMSKKEEWVVEET